jgi:dTDP-4-dehydrorhamnose reductase
LGGGERLLAANDTTMSARPYISRSRPTAALDLFIDGERGIWHLANGGAITWYAFGQAPHRRALTGFRTHLLEAAPGLGGVAGGEKTANARLAA